MPANKRSGTPVAWQYLYSAELQTRTFAKVARVALFTSGARSGGKGAKDDTPMGKSDKKVRAESINKLRKQYDAFLEEDRKRKERNEDILSKLDKMRSTVTRYKGNLYNDQRSPIPSFSEIPANNIRYNEHEPQIPMRLDIRSKNADESYFLSQISKKYILIPKSRSAIDTEYIPRAIKQDNNNDSDWKSKYSILDKLKQAEKEGMNNAVGNVKYDDPSHELLMHQKDGEYTNISETPVKDTRNKIADEFTPPTRDLREYQFDESVKELNYTDDHKEEAPLRKNRRAFVTNLPSKFDDALNISNHKNENTTTTNNVHQQVQSKYDGSTVSPTETNLANHKVHEENDPNLHKNVSDNQNFSENDSKYEMEGTEKEHSESNDHSKTKVIPPVELAQKTSDDTINRDSNDMNYPIDVINVQDFTPNDDVTLVDGVNINPEGHDVNTGYYVSSYQHAPERIAAVEQDENIAHQQSATVVTENLTQREGEVYTEPIQEYVNPEQNIGEVYNEPTQQYVNPEEQNISEVYNEPNHQYNTTTDTSMENVMGIQAFETEQNELFYSEQPGQNYEQYNQGDAYNVGYTGPEGYDPAAYYESAQQEAYPVDVNEHEETTQRYDPSYEQQYVGPLAEDPQFSEQAEYQEQAPDPEVLVPTFMEHDPTQYETEQLPVAAQVEQQLDDEAGYYVQGTADEDYTLQNTDGSAPYEQTPDQTVLQAPANVAPEKET